MGYSPGNATPSYSPGEPAYSPSLQGAEVTGNTTPHPADYSCSPSPSSSPGPKYSWAGGRVSGSAGNTPQHSNTPAQTPVYEGGASNTPSHTPVYEGGTISTPAQTPVYEGASTTPSHTPLYEVSTSAQTPVYEGASSDVHGNLSSGENTPQHDADVVPDNTE